MTQRGRNTPGPEQPFSTMREATSQSGPVFPGKPTTPNPYGKHNLAVQRSLMEIFDEFTDVISGELKSMNLDDVAEGELDPKRLKSG